MNSFSLHMVFVFSTCRFHVFRNITIHNFPFVDENIICFHQLNTTTLNYIKQNYVFNNDYKINFLFGGNKQIFKVIILSTSNHNSFVGPCEASSKKPAFTWSHREDWLCLMLNLFLTQIGLANDMDDIKQTELWFSNILNSHFTLWKLKLIIHFAYKYNKQKSLFLNICSFRGLKLSTMTKSLPGLMISQILLII